MPLSKEKERIKRRQNRGSFCSNCELAKVEEGRLICTISHSVVVPRKPACRQRIAGRPCQGGISY